MIIQKILRYDIYAGTSGSERYARVCNLLNQTIEPDTLSLQMLDCHGQSVATSPRKRAKECIKESSAQSIVEIPALNEIAFSLRDFCSEESFVTNGSSAVRSAFIEAFKTNTLLIPHTQLQEELQYIMSLANEASSPQLCVSHTFRMKLIEIYNLIGDELFRNPNRIQEYIDPQNHLYDFGETIEIC